MKPLHEMTNEELVQTVRQYRRMIRRLAAKMPYQEHECQRASGLALCPACQLELYEHPTINGLTMDCYGRTYHL